MKQLLAIAVLVGSLFGCTEDVPQQPIVPKASEEEVKQKLEEFHLRKGKEERHAIEMYVQQNQLNIESTGTGLRYQIYEQGTGPAAFEGCMALVDFTIMLLNGDTCYTSLTGEPVEFRVDMDDVESGLHEGIKKMHVGDKAILIIPFRLAHGLVGDQDKVPPQSTIVYDINLLDIQVPLE